VFAVVGLQPFHRGPDNGSPSGAATICGAQRDGSLGGPCANDRAGANKSTTTEDTVDTVEMFFQMDLCALCGGEFLVII
jgi:hypothetical protein